MDNTSRGFPAGDMRVSHADRERAVAELSAAFQVGRLTQEEFEERSGQALLAKTGKELIALFADLPPDHVPVAHAPTAPPARSLERSGRVVAARVAVGAAALGAVSLGALALANALGTASAPANSAKRAFAEQVMGGRTIKINLSGQPHVAGFDWAGTLAPAVVALLLIALIVITLRATRVVRAGRA
jgi:hypothetical protein